VQITDSAGPKTDEDLIQQPVPAVITDADAVSSVAFPTQSPPSQSQGATLGGIHGTSSPTHGSVWLVPDTNLRADSGADSTSSSESPASTNNVNVPASTAAARGPGIPASSSLEPVG
jgi:hypothetical protein